jgi:dTDP-4-amino-4,6-dideoxygalactose transaminase
MNSKEVWPYFSKKEAALVSKTILSNKVNYLFGSQGKKFEEMFSNFSDCKYALAVANGTLALDLSLRALRLKSGDEVIVSSRSFIASASAISLLGGTPVWADVDINTQNIDPANIRKKITKKTRGIICVHFSGMPCDMIKIMKIAKDHNLWVLEDCAQAHGAKIKNKSVGSFGDISAWSFCNDKIMSLAGEGGMITTNDTKLYKFISSFNNHGKNLNKYFSNKTYKSFPYLHDFIGSNYRLTEMQSTIGIYQLSKMPQWNNLRKRNAEIIIGMVDDLEIVNTPIVKKVYQHAWYKLYITLNLDKIKSNIKRFDIISILNQKGVPCSFGGCGEIYNEPAYNPNNQKAKIKLANAHQLQNTSLMFQVHPTITKKSIIKNAKIIRSVLIDSSK